VCLSVRGRPWSRWAVWTSLTRSQQPACAVLPKNRNEGPEDIGSAMQLKVRPDTLSAGLTSGRFVLAYAGAGTVVAQGRRGPGRQNEADLATSSWATLLSRQGLPSQFHFLTHKGPHPCALGVNGEVTVVVWSPLSAVYFCGSYYLGITLSDEPLVDQCPIAAWWVRQCVSGCSGRGVVSA
jgi:hypothetical protein